MKYISLLFIWLSATLTWAQSNVMVSNSDVRFMVTHDPATGLFTAWIVPGYDTPNANNPESEDRGATAQFSLKVPASFVLTDIRDLKGSWEKSPYKLVAPEGFTGDSGWAYYIIGKSPSETNYGTFTKGEPVALFTFKGKGGSSEQVNVLANDDPFLQFAESKMALHIRNSFYTRSGQRATLSALPIEQMSGIIKLDEVLKQKQAQLGISPTGEGEDIATLSVQAYPNPTTDIIELKYFSAIEQMNITFDLIDNQGNVKQSNSLNAKVGFNNTRFVVSNLSGGVYFVRSIVQGQRIAKKIVKQ
ncbi:T9SS type A sorting domain-containing protein [Spirosoma sp. BT702]|uniref:T9SS type A sorting domain-containing protein n=1 Tax=Spirosoma profusum TaxID=2771354 RepID=A0A927GA78_9BACT|nr:T9SS type A sorting domain-containing protein [Spirosoma profusum]MBD2705336.1 T9SS type A sorting domain-containing protein [Spirosoma profusum]